MTEPIDPNAQWAYPPPPSYQPPPPASYQPPPSPELPWLSAPGFPPPWAPQWPPPPPPSHTRRNVVIALVVVVLLAAAGVAGYFVLRKPGSSGNKVVLPTFFDGYSKLTNNEADSVTSMMRSMANAAGGGAAGAIFDNAAIGVYAKDSGDQPAMIVFALRTSDLPPAAAADPDTITSQLLTIAGPGAVRFPAGSHGGTLRCANAQFGVASETACAWSDADTTGMTVQVRPPVTTQALASVADDLRDQIR